MTNNGTTRATIETPIICTTSADEGSEQLTAWEDLQELAIEVIAVESGARMTLPAAIVNQVRDLVRRESACCAFLDLDITVDGEVMVLEVTAPNPDARPVIRALAGLPSA